MAKVNRFNGGVKGSAVPGGTTGVDPRLGLAGVAGALADVTDTLATGAAALEKDAAIKLRDSMKAKQAVLDEVEAGRREEDYADSLRTFAQEAQAEHDKDPQNAISKFQVRADEAADAAVKAAGPNVEVQLMVARAANSRRAVEVGKLATWAQAKLTQNAKVDLSVLVNRATAGAETLPSAPALADYIATREAALSRVFAGVYGDDASEKMAKMKSGMAKAWTTAASDKDPIGVLTALEEGSGPLVDYLDVEDRKAARSQAKSSYEGLARTRELEAVKSGIARGDALATALLAEDPGLPGTLYANRIALEEQKKAVKLRFSVDAAALKKAGIDPEGYDPEDLVAVIDDQLAYTKALNDAYRRRTTAVAEDDPAAVEGLIVTQDKALKSKKGKDMASIVKQQRDLAVALAGKKISQGTFSTMFRTMSLALKTASDKMETPAWDWHTWGAFRAPYTAGNMAINKHPDFVKAPADVQARVRLSYQGAFNDATANGTAVNDVQARNMALRALSLETETPLPGVK